MKVIDVSKVIKEVKKKDPNVDEGKVFAELCLAVMEQKNAYRGSRALTESELPEGLEDAVRTYFVEHKYRGRLFKLARLERSSISETVIYAVPEGVYEDIGDEDAEFDEGLDKIGEKFGVPIKLPWYCYAK